MHKKTLILVVAVLAAAVCYTSCGGSEIPKEAAAKESAPVRVSAITVRESAQPAYYEATGTVRARTAAVLSAKVMGYVREVSAAIGDRVRAGQILVVLDSRDLEAAYRQAEAARNEARNALPEADNGIASARAAMDLAEVTLRRMKDLFDKDSISRQEYDEAQMRMKVARANYEMALAKKEQLRSRIDQAEQGLASASVMRSYSRIAAPFDGVITEKPVEPGSLAAPGQPLLTIERAGGYRLEAAVDESKVAAVHAGQKVDVALDALDRSLEGRVAEVVPAVDAASRTFTAKIDLPSAPQLRSGLFGRARFALGTRRQITIPPEALIERGQLTSVYVADGGFARSRLVTIGQRGANTVEILSGLDQGERVIAPAPAGLGDGARVEVSR